MRPALITFSLLACVAGGFLLWLGVSPIIGIGARSFGVFGLIAAVAVEPEI